MKPEELRDLINSYEREAKALKTQIIDICIHMQGGVELNTAWGISYQDRELIIKAINKKNKENNPNAKEYM